MNGHPDTEALSAFLDGEAPEVESHVAACGECRHRLDALGQARAAVAAPVRPPAASQKDAAIAAAVRGASGRDERPAPPGRWKVFAVAGAVAAAAVIGVVVTRAGTSHKSPTAALGKAGPVSKDLVRAGDLGDVDDAQALRAKIQPGLPAGAAVRGQAQAATPAAPGAGAGAPANRSAATAQRGLSAAAGETPRCEAAARALQPSGAALVYEATARWQGTPADVFGFSPPGSQATSVPGRPTPTRVYVLARSDCHLLVFQSFAP
jgi:hypothetical protein